MHTMTKHIYVNHRLVKYIKPLKCYSKNNFNGFSLGLCLIITTVVHSLNYENFRLTSYLWYGSPRWMKGRFKCKEGFL